MTSLNGQTGALSLFTPNAQTATYQVLAGRLTSRKLQDNPGCVRDVHRHPRRLRVTTILRPVHLDSELRLRRRDNCKKWTEYQWRDS